MKLKDLTELEKKTYEFVKKVGEIQPKNMPNRRIVGAVINLKNKGLIEIYKRQISQEEEEICKGERTKRTPNKTLPNVYPLGITHLSQNDHSCIIIDFSCETLSKF